MYWFRHVCEYGSDGMIPPVLLMRAGGFLVNADRASGGTSEV